METLERIKRWPQLLSRFPSVRIYSAEHDAYWRGTGQGYTISPQESHIWPIEKALARTRHCCPMKRIQFINAVQETKVLKIEMDITKKMTESELAKALLGLQTTLAAKNKIIDELVEALESLYSEQNGVPLLRHQNSWQHAMDLTLTILEKVRVKE